MRSTVNTSEQEKRASKYIWLSYFNRYLFEKGVITITEYKRMVERIEVYVNKKSPSKK